MNMQSQSQSQSADSTSTVTFQDYETTDFYDELIAEPGKTETGTDPVG